MVAQFGEDRVVAYTRILQITISIFFRRYAWGNAYFFVICFFLRLELVHALGIILLTGGNVTAVHAIDIVECACAKSTCYALTSYEVMLGKAVLVHREDACGIECKVIRFVEGDTLRRAIDIRPPSYRSSL